MKLEDFDFHLPEELIAQKAAEPRDSSSLFFYDK
jgi:S-adenosylmethionine:tRNA-ribosyltransferase-isomerase (queuine synthetase)